MSVESLQQRITDAYSSANAESAGSTMSSVRKQAWESYQAIGIPTTRHEEWKYTNLPSRLARVAQSWQPVVKRSESTVHTLGGIYVRIHKNSATIKGDVPAGLTIRMTRDEAVLSHFIVEDGWYNPFVAVSDAVLREALLIRVEPNAQIADTIHIVIEGQESEPDALSLPRILVHGEKGSECTIVTHVRSESALSVCAGLVNVRIEENAKAEVIHIVDDSTESTQLWTVHGTVRKGGRLNTVSAVFKSGFVRNDTIIRLLDPGAEGYMFGITVADGNSHIDNHTVVDHIAPHCHSEELYKGVYDGSSSGVFNGKIFVRQDAQKTTAYQANHNILLSPNAQVNAKPQLEIWADDVKCSHGATSGQLNEDAIFYLRSRGIDEVNARALLTYAFAAQVADKIENEDVRAWVHGRISQSLGTKAFG